MSFEGAALNATLAAAAGDDLLLQSELRSALIHSANKQLDLLKRSRCDGNWNVAAMRLKSLAASFHADNLIEAADIALSSAPGDPIAIQRVDEEISHFLADETRD